MPKNKQFLANLNLLINLKYIKNIAILKIINT